MSTARMPGRRNPPANDPIEDEHADIVLLAWAIRAFVVAAAILGIAVLLALL